MTRVRSTLGSTKLAVSATTSATAPTWSVTHSIAAAAEGL